MARQIELTNVVMAFQGGFLTNRAEHWNLDYHVEGGQVIVTKRVEGEVQFNDGESAEVQTYGIEGIEKDLLLKTVHIHREDTGNTSDEFQKRFSVGTVLEITTTTEFTIKLEPGLDWQDLRTAVSGGRVN